MADTKTTGLAALAETPAAGDLLMIVDVSDTTMSVDGTNKKIAYSNLPTGIANVVEDTTPQLGGALDAQGYDINNGGVIFLTEQAEAEADVAGKGQLWVDTATPNVLMFTDDAGTDAALTTPANTQTFTNKTIDADGTGNSITNIENADIKAAAGIAVNKLAALTASEIVGSDASGFLTSLAVATYPSLTELSYVKGVSSAIQTQLGTKAPLASPTFTGTVTLPTGLTGVVRADSGVVSVDGDVTDIVTAATTSAAGKVEIAVASEINTGTDTGRAISPDSLAGSNFGLRPLEVAAFDYTTDCAVGDGAGYVTVPSSYAGMNLVAVHARCITAGTTGTMDIQVHNLTQTADMLSTKITIDTTETGSDTAAAPAVIDAANDDVAAYDLIRIDVDAVHTTAAKGLIVTLEFRLP